MFYLIIYNNKKMKNKKKLVDVVRHLSSLPDEDSPS